jgi:integrase
MKKTNYLKNGKEYYRIVRVVGHKEDGSPIKKEFYAAGKKEAIEKAEEYINKLKNGMSLDFENVTVSDLMHKWLFHIKLNELKPSSFQSYESIFRNLIKDSDISGLKVHSVKSIHIQEYYNKLGKEKTYSQIKKLNKLLKQFFSYTEREGYILRNPCNNITIPNQIEQKKTKSETIEYFNDSEIKQLKKAFKDNKFYNLVLTALGTGLRQGELLALKWENVDLINKTINVKESIKKVYIFDSERK